MYRIATNFCIWLSFYHSLGVTIGQVKAYNGEGLGAKSINVFLRSAIHIMDQSANNVSVRMDNT